jgi:hypothetical protein
LLDANKTRAAIPFSFYNNMKIEERGKVLFVLVAVAAAAANIQG